MLLNDKGVPYVEHCIDGDHAARNAMAARVGGRRTVPQIVINDRAVGGYSELARLDSTGELDRVLAQAS